MTHSIVLITTACALLSVIKAGCVKADAVTFLSFFNRSYPKLASIDIPNHQNLILGCKLDGPKQFVLLYPDNTSLKITTRVNQNEFFSTVDDDSLERVEVDVPYCVNSFYDLKYFIPFFDNKKVTINQKDFTVTDGEKAHKDSFVKDSIKVCKGLVRDTSNNATISVNLVFVVSGYTMDTDITYQAINSPMSSNQITTESE